MSKPDSQGLYWFPMFQSRESFDAFAAAERFPAYIVLERMFPKKMPGLNLLRHTFCFMTHLSSMYMRSLFSIFGRNLP